MDCGGWYCRRLQRVPVVAVDPILVSTLTGRSFANACGETRQNHRAMVGISAVHYNLDRMSRLLARVGIAFLIVVVLTHVAERWHFFPEMGWGLPNSPGHYLDLASAILGVGLVIAALIWRQFSS